jgi:hypothetical protein
MSLPEEKFDEGVWHVLKKIKERSLFADTEKRVPYFVIAEFDNLSNNPPPLDDELSVLKKLARDGVIKLITSEISEGEKRTDLYIDIIQPAFNQLYEIHYIFTDTNQKRREKDSKQPIGLKNLEITFDDDKAILKFGKQNVALPPYKNEHYFCQVVFEHKPKEPISWDIIYDRMTGHSAISGGIKPEPTRENWQKVNDTMKRLNNRIKEMAKINEKLFVWSEKMVIRNY